VELQEQVVGRDTPAGAGRAIVALLVLLDIARRVGNLDIAGSPGLVPRMVRAEPQAGPGQEKADNLDGAEYLPIAERAVKAGSRAGAGLARAGCPVTVGSAEAAPPADSPACPRPVSLVGLDAAARAACLVIVASLVGLDWAHKATPESVERVEYQGGAAQVQPALFKQVLLALSP